MIPELQVSENYLMSFGAVMILGKCSVKVQMLGINTGTYFHFQNSSYTTVPQKHKSTDLVNHL